MEDNTNQLLQDLTAIETVAEDILADKHKMVDLDRHRNQTRQAVREIQRAKGEDKHWLCLGGVFIKMEKKAASRLLEKDFNQTEEELNKTRVELKPKVNHLLSLEKKEGIEAFQLQPLSHAELDAVLGL